MSSQISATNPVGKVSSPEPPEQGQRAEDLLPFRTKVAYGVGGVLDNVMQYGVKGMSSVVLNMTLGINPLLVGLATTLPRLWDAFIDPLVGNFSDNYRGKWGRRRPLIAVGAILSAIFFVLLWTFPPMLSAMGKYWYFVGMSLLFYSCYALFTVPYNALGFELTPDYHERTQVLAYRSFFTAICGFLNQWIFWLTQRPIFNDTIHGTQMVSIGIAFFIIGLGLMPVFFAKERFVQTKPLRKKESAKENFWKNFRESLSNRPFRLVLMMILLVMGSNMTVALFGQYITIYYMFGGDMEKASLYQGISGTAYNISYLLSAPLLVWFSSRYGKRATLLIFIGLQGLGALSKWWCYSVDHPWLVVIPSVLYGPGYAAAWTMGASMVADSCDADELEWGKRREGLFSSVFMWCHKTAFSITALVSGAIIAMTGFRAELGGNQPEGALFTMRALFAFLPALATVGALFVIARYSLTETRMRAIRTELETRRAMATG